MRRGGNDISNQQLPIASSPTGDSLRGRRRFGFARLSLIVSSVLIMAGFFFFSHVFDSQSATVAQPTGLLQLRGALNRPKYGGLSALNLTLEELRSYQVHERIHVLEQIRHGYAALEISEDRKHGIVGLDDDAEIHWKPQSPPSEDLDIVKALREGGGFNLRLSDSIPLDRNLSDFRHKQCSQIRYDTNRLKPASVVIVFFNEPFSTLMRSVHSVLNLTPPKILHEIVLVDDGSTIPWIAADGTGELEKYIGYLPKTKLVRLPVRQGIVAARMAGIRAAESEIFVILDSHVEVQPYWLEPMLSRIQNAPSTIVMPQVDSLDPETFEPRDGGIGCTLTFLWKLIEHGYDASSLSPMDRIAKRPSDFVSSPTMAGGLFAANKRFFLEDLGGYDEQFEYWGTENLELSFKTWQCGGRLECAPCSRVYHIFRKGGTGYSSPPYATTKNKLRTLAVWMDEYADLAWRVIGKPSLDFGPYEDNLKWKNKHCKNFQYFLNAINPENFVQTVPADVPFLGPIQNVESSKCLDSFGDNHPDTGNVRLSDCKDKQSQDFMYFARVKHIMPVTNDEACLVTGNDGQLPAGKMHWCHTKHHEWTIDSVEGGFLLLRNGAQCLSQAEESLIFAECNQNDSNQLWNWPAYNPPKIWTPPPTLEDK